MVNKAGQIVSQVKVTQNRCSYQGGYVTAEVFNGNKNLFTFETREGAYGAKLFGGGEHQGLVMIHLKE